MVFDTWREFPLYMKKVLGGNFNAGIISNFTLLNDEIVRYLVENNIGCGVSLDGTIHSKVDINGNSTSKKVMEDVYKRQDVCDVATAKIIKREVSDGVIAPGYEPEALEILKAKKKGNYNVIEIDENYVPKELERKEVFGITFEQGRNELKIDENFFSDIVTENKDVYKRQNIQSLRSYLRSIKRL